MCFSGVLEVSFRSAEFKSFFVNEGGAKETSANYYASYLKRIDEALGGLDEAIAAKGSDKLMEWAAGTSQPPFDTKPSNPRSVLKKYLQFHINAQAPDGEIERELAANEEPPPAPGTVFQLEKEMQRAVRRQLDRLEPGLIAADGGVEYIVATGRIDVLAKDKNGNHVVIELKAGACPSGALEQALGYAQSLSDDRKDIALVRVMLIAAEFSDRMRAAAKRIPNCELKQYEFSLQFKEVT